MWQLVGRPLGQIAVSYKTRPGDSSHHMEAVYLRPAGQRALRGLVAFLRHGPTALGKLARADRAVVHRMLQAQPDLPAASAALLVSGEDEPSEDRRKRPAPADQHTPHKRAAAPPALPACEDHVLTCADGGTVITRVPLLSVSSEDRGALEATMSDPPAITKYNADRYPPPNLSRSRDARRPGSTPYIWYMQMKGHPWDGETASYDLARKEYKALGHRRQGGAPPTATALAEGASVPPPSTPPVVSLPASDCAPAPPSLRPTPAFRSTPRPPPAPLASTSTPPMAPSAPLRCSLAVPPPSTPPVVQQVAAGARPRLPTASVFRARASLAPPAVSTHPSAKTGNAAKRIISIKNVTPQSDCDSGEILARLMDLTHGVYRNASGEGSRARMIVADESGDIQISTFEGVGALVDRLRVNGVYRFPLAEVTFSMKDKFNYTTGSAFQLKLSKFGTQHVREVEGDHPGLPVHNFTFVPIAAIAQLAVGTYVDVCGVVVNAEDVKPVLSKAKGIEGSRRVLTIADNTHSIQLTVWAAGVQHIDGDVGCVVTVKGKRSAYLGVPTLTADHSKVDFRPTISEADELRELWAQTPPAVTPVRAGFTPKPIASLANVPSKEQVGLLAVVSSADAPAPYTAAATGAPGRLLRLVVCDQTAAVSLTLFAPAEGGLPAFARGALISVAAASLQASSDDVKVTCSLDRCTLEPREPHEAVAALREWWASRPDGYVAPRVFSHPLVPIATLPSISPEACVRVVAVVVDAEPVENARTAKGGEASRRKLFLADASAKSVEVTIHAPRVQEVGGEHIVGSIIALEKARTRVFQGTPVLRAFLVGARGPNVLQRPICACCAAPLLMPRLCSLIVPRAGGRRLCADAHGGTHAVRSVGTDASCRHAVAASARSQVHCVARGRGQRAVSGAGRPLRGRRIGQATSELQGCERHAAAPCEFVCVRYRRGRAAHHLPTSRGECAGVSTGHVAVGLAGKAWPKQRRAEMHDLPGPCDARAMRRGG